MLCGVGGLGVVSWKCGCGMVFGCICLLVNSCVRWRVIEVKEKDLGI